MSQFENFQVCTRKISSFIVMYTLEPLYIGMLCVVHFETWYRTGASDNLDTNTWSWSDLPSNSFFLFPRSNQVSAHRATLHFAHSYRVSVLTRYRLSDPSEALTVQTAQSFFWFVVFRSCWNFWVKVSFSQTRKRIDWRLLEWLSI